VTGIDTRDPTNAGGGDRVLPYDLGGRNSLPVPIAPEPSTSSSSTVSPRDTEAQQRPGSYRRRSRRTGSPGMPIGDAVPRRLAGRHVAGMDTWGLPEMRPIDDPQEVSVSSLELSSLPPTIKVEEAAMLLGISRSAAYRAAKAGQLRTLRMGRRVLVPTAPLLRLLGR
jgi:excisionase family DNA binding protein